MYLNHKGGIVNKVTLIIGTGMALISLPLTAENSKSPSAVISNTDCSKEILLAYFPDVFVKETLAKFKVPADKWDAIVKGLNERDKNIIKIIEEKAQKLSPNPLKDSQQRQAAVKLFRETLLEQFSEVVKVNGITDDKQIQSMLDDVQQQKAKHFAMCIKNPKNIEGDDGEESDDYDADEDDVDSDESDSDDDDDSKTKPDVGDKRATKP